LQVLAVIQESKRRVSEVCRVFDPLPQLLKNVRFGGGAPLDDDLVKEAIRDGEARLDGIGRLLIRKSGTEPVIRVMAEGDDESLVNAVVGDIVNSIQQAAAREQEAAE
jgi:phosphoglucosamine mutase